MKFEDLTGEQIETAKKIYQDKGQKWDSRIFQLMNIFGVSERTTRIWISKLNSNVKPSKQKQSHILEKTVTRNKVLDKIIEIYSESELLAISKGGRIIAGLDKVPIISFEGQHLKIGVITDTHIGHLNFSKERLFQAFEEFKKEKVDFIVHSGDVTEGMSHRDGHIYELNALGYDAQKKMAIDIFRQWGDTEIYAIDGNHDRWFIKSNGALIVKDIADTLTNFHFIGHDEGDISLKGKATLKLWHGEDGNSYALSYRLQKIVESFSGGEKPSMMICGHTHKYVKIFERNIHCVSAGTMETQTKWMRGKKIAAHVGFVIIDVWVNDNGISKFGDTWYPFYT